jgi:hypothetical protein
MREHGAAHTAATQDAAANQKPQELAVFVVAGLILALIFFFNLVLMSFAEKMREQRATHAGATQ